jgi:hypothetical protein
MRQDEGRQYAKEQREYIIVFVPAYGQYELCCSGTDVFLGKTLLPKRKYTVSQSFRKSAVFFITHSQEPTTGPDSLPLESSLTYR